MDRLEFAVTWDYRCPFARNFLEHVITGLEAGAPWEVTFVPFSLEQAHVAEGEPDVWEQPETAPGLLAMQAGIAVRDHVPLSALAVHRALFEARHDQGLDIREPAVVHTALSEAGVDAAAVFSLVDTGEPLETFRKEHERAVVDHAVFGVPTVIAGDQAVFIRMMHRPRGDAELAVRTVEQAVRLVTGWPELNEFKHTTIPR